MQDRIIINTVNFKLASRIGTISLIDTYDILDPISREPLPQQPFMRHTGANTHITSSRVNFDTLEDC